jgi:predicted outer membrane repeat protein
MRLCLLLAAILSAAPAASAQIFVDAAAAGLNNGASWIDAYTDLQDALAGAIAGDEIWVAQGTYAPTTVADRSALFDLVNSVEMYGGFAGGETALEERDIAANETVLSGEIGAPGPTDNCYQVVRALSVGAGTVLDGFTIRDGYNDIGICGGLRVSGTFCNPIIANLVITNNTAIDGGGIFVNAINTNVSLSNIVVSNNTATNYGGGIYIRDTDTVVVPTWINISVVDNDAGQWGGGMRIHNGALVIDGFEFKRNTANIGGGVRSQLADLTLHNGVVADNTADFTSGGGISALGSNEMRLYNVAVYGNHARRQGGGILSSNAIIDLVNVTVFGNTAGDYGGGVHLTAGPPRHALVVNSIIAGNDAPVDPNVQRFGAASEYYYSMVEGSGGSTAWDDSIGVDLGGNIDAVPHLIDPAGDDFRLYHDSPGIDAGDGGAPTAFDLNGDDRVVGAAIDMGATEFRGCPPGSRLYVSSTATGAADGTSWTDAYTEVREALAMACPNITEMWIAAGSYTPTAAQDQFQTFELRNGLALFGGFEGIETALSQRNVSAHESVLDGNNVSFNVVTGSGTDATAILDGLSIARGEADTFRPNGGGMYNDAGSPTVRNVVFYDNFAINGGGVGNFNGSAPQFENVVLHENVAAFGGGMYNESSAPCLVNVVFDRNVALNSGAGLVNIAGSPAALTNCTMSGGLSGMINVASDPVIINTIVWGVGAAPVTNLSAANPVFSHSLIAGSGGSAAWDASYGTDGGGNLDIDPLFADAPNGNLRLLFGSPAFDVGDNSAPKLPATDADGGARIIGGVVDMGAYESPVATGIGDTPAAVAAIRSAYPNPFNPAVTVSFDLESPARVRLLIYDVRGRVVRTLLDRELAAGAHYEKWDARDDTGAAVSSGVYFAVLQAGSRSDRRKITLLK